MKPLHYIVSNNGFGVAIGIVGNKRQALEDATLAENIFGSNHSDHLFTHLLYMSSVEQFKKFLILKEYFSVWDEHFGRNKVAGRRDSGMVMQFTRRAIKREMAIAFMNGATIAALAGIGVTLWFQNFHLGFVIAAAMQCNILLAGFAGVFIPVMLDRFDQDPAVASSVFVTMITDSMGFLIFLSLAVFSGLVG